MNTPFMIFPHTVPCWTKFVTADRVQTMQTGGLQPSPRDVSTYADTKITIKIRFDISLCLLLPAQVGQHPPVPGEQWWWADQRQQEDSDTLVMAALQKPEQTLVPTKMSPHRAAHPSSHPAPAAELLPSRTGWGSQVPPPAAAPTWASSTAACYTAQSHVFQIIAKLLGILKIKLCTHRGSKTLQLQCSYQTIYPYCKQDLTICLNSTDFRGHKGLLNFHYTSYLFYSYMDMLCLLMYSTDSFHSRLLLLTHKWKSR